MAFLGQTFDASQIEPSAAFEVIPAGKYHVQIVNSEMRDTKSGSGQYLWMELSIMDGPHANKRLFERINLVNPNEKAVEIGQRTLSAICHATGQMSVSDSEQLHHKSLIAVVKVRPAGPDKDNVHREASNEIGGYLPINGAQTGAYQGGQTAAAAPSQAAPASQPTAAAQKLQNAPWKRNVA